MLVFQDFSVGRYCYRARRWAVGLWSRTPCLTHWTWPNRWTAQQTGPETTRNRLWTVWGKCRWTCWCPLASRCPRTLARSGPALTGWWSKATTKRTSSPIYCQSLMVTAGPAWLSVPESFKSSSSAVASTSTTCCSASSRARRSGDSAPTTYR